MSSSNIAAASLDTEKVAAVWRQDGVAGHESQLYYNVWDASQDFDAWGIMAGNGPFKNGKDRTLPQYYATIHSADIGGDGLAELLGRGATRMVAYRFNDTGSQLVCCGRNPWQVWLFSIESPSQRGKE